MTICNQGQTDVGGQKNVRAVDQVGGLSFCFGQTKD